MATGQWPPDPADRRDTQESRSAAGTLTRRSHRPPATRGPRRVIAVTVGVVLLLAAAGIGSWLWARHGHRTELWRPARLILGEVPITRPTFNCRFERCPR